MCRFKPSEEWGIKLSEKESFLKSFVLFFAVIEGFLLFIFYHHYRLEVEHLKERIFLEMKNYAFSLEGEGYGIDIVSAPQDATRYYQLEESNQTLYILAPLPQDSSDALQITYPASQYRRDLYAIVRMLVVRFSALSVLALVISLLFSWYVLKPVRGALKTLEGFMKDLIHDLNTPLSAILINLKMMEQSQERQSIEQSARTIAMLHRNMESYLKEHAVTLRRFELCKIVQTQGAFFARLYDEVELTIECPASVPLHSDPDAFERIIQNLLSNAFKYNKPQGYVRITYQSNILSIANTSLQPIKYPDRLFERFYKENERGLGIGLHITYKLCEALGIDITLQYDGQARVITFYLDLSKLTQN